MNSAAASASVFASSSSSTDRNKFQMVKIPECNLKYETNRKNQKRRNPLMSAE